jgi:hypothetical protein
MSWSLDIKANRKISPRSVETALRKMDAIDSSGSAQEWGWPCIVDVNLPKGRTLQLSGSEFSMSDAEDFALELASTLRKLHYKITIGQIRD